MLKKLSNKTKITIYVLAVFIGIGLLTLTYFKGIKSNLFNQKNIELMEQSIVLSEDVGEIDNIEDIEDIEEYVEPDTTVTKPESTPSEYYIGYVSVPSVGIKRGFTSVNSKYNTVNKNVMLIDGSDMPDVEKGNLILASHRGTSSVSFFDKLYKLKDGDEAIITYNGKTYTYKLENQYNVPKTGKITISRNPEVNTLTLITCTRTDKYSQTVFIFELKSIK